MERDYTIITVTKDDSLDFDDRLAEIFNSASGRVDVIGYQILWLRDTFTTRYVATLKLYK